ncbi:MAG: DUF4192 domain-containing protein [Rhodococcus sp. (in: high G+C Gram-positive bacteria)]|uniref:DUF4192 domain-containing protein n=1 Tax=Rhodococcus sp. TaxID=1831 RepID=UPI003BAF24E9
MTIPSYPHGFEFSDDSHTNADQWRGPARVRLSDPGDLLAAVPGLLGFPPERSIVAVCLSGRPVSTLGAVMRHDLVLGCSGTPTASMRAALEHFGSVFEREQATGVLVVVVDDRFAYPDEMTSRRELCAVIESLENLLATTSTELLDVFITAEIAEGAEWFSYFGDGRGLQSDPMASHIALARVLEGRAIRSSREELEATVEAGPALERRHIAELIEIIRESVDLRRELARRSNPLRGDRQELESVLAHIARVSAGEPLLAPECAELALALTNPAVRDSLLALAVGDFADDAEQLWTFLVRCLPDPERATAAALLGYSAYVRGEGPMAGIALAAALESDPDHGLAQLLDTALQSGLRPVQVRELASMGFDRAAELGVALPRATDD